MLHSLRRDGLIYTLPPVPGIAWGQYKWWKVTHLGFQVLQRAYAPGTHLTFPDGVKVEVPDYVPVIA